MFPFRIPSVLVAGTLLVAATAHAQNSHPTRPPESIGQTGARPDSAPQRPAETWGQQRPQGAGQGGQSGGGAWSGGGRPGGGGGRPR